MLAALEAKFEAFWHKVDGDAEAELRAAKADVETALADVKAQVADAAPVLAEFEAGLKSLLATAEPQLKTEGEALLGKLLTAFGPLLGKAAAGL
jgi:hypothetical protein